MTSASKNLPLPDFFSRDRVAEVYRVPYQLKATAAEAWTQQQKIELASSDRDRVGLLLIDVQNTFCIPEFELFVGGKSGMGAVEDNIRLCQFIYQKPQKSTATIV